MIEQLRADRQAALEASRHAGGANVTIADEGDTSTSAHEIWILDHILDPSVCAQLLTPTCAGKLCMCVWRSASYMCSRFYAVFLFL